MNFIESLRIFNASTEMKGISKCQIKQKQYLFFSY